MSLECQPDLKTALGENWHPRLYEMEPALLSSLICVDAGNYNTAAGFIAARHYYTAAHNLHAGFANIIQPATLVTDTFEFTIYEPDTAVSLQSIEAVHSFSVGKPEFDDDHLVFWLRHLGGGKFSPSCMWGTNVGLKVQSGKKFWGFQRLGAEPKLGDSGALVLTIGRSGHPIEPIAVGILRGSLEGNKTCVFSSL